MRSLLCIACIGLMSCSGNSAAVPKSICETAPRSLFKWVGSDVRWKGLLVDVSPHGLFFYGECKTPKVLQVVDLPDGAATEQLEATMNENSFKPGVLRVEFSGTLIERQTRSPLTGELFDSVEMRVTEIHSFRFERMSETEDREYWNAIYGD